MANVCSTTYAFEGTAEAIEKFHAFLIQVAGRNCCATATNILAAAGLNPKDYSIPADVTYIDDSVQEAEPKGNGRLFFKACTDSAWSEKPELFHEVFKALGLDGIEIFYIAEESGCEYFVKHDPSGKYFPEEYCVDNGIEDVAVNEKYGIESDGYTREELLRHLQDAFGAGKSFEELLAAARELDDKLSEEDKGFFNIAKYEEV